jgi:glycosyltransferase involved in cell wall biosynthesis
MALPDRGRRKATEAAPPGRPLRVLVASHGHPEISKGGAENAAFQLFTELRDWPGTEAWFLGCGVLPGQGAELCITQPFSDREYLYAPSAFNWFNFANRDPRLPRELERLLLELAPDVVHFHHYVHFGVEIFSLVRRVLPDVRIVLTLHEYLAICHHFGQMVTRGELHLCRRASDARCAGCFPDIAPSDFFLRRRYVQGFFDLVDQFTAPSAFLAQRYVQWGLPEARMAVLENLIPPVGEATTEEVAGDSVLRVGFFGQISRLKGIEVLLGAAEQLAADARQDISFAIYGDYRNQPEVFRADLEKRLAAPGFNVRFYGPYEREEIDGLMRGVDVVLIPSIWWENAPLVVEEALRNGRPVLCSDIGGMAEKVRHGIDGFHFRMGSQQALADLLKRLAENRGLLKGIGDTMRRPAAMSVTLKAHVNLYRRSLSNPPAVVD